MLIVSLIFMDTCVQLRNVFLKRKYLEAASGLESFLPLNELRFSSLKGFISLTAEANDMLNTRLVVNLLVFDT